MPGIDLRIYKGELRAERKAYRASLSPEQKAVMDSAVAARVFSRPEYQQSKKILIYASTKIEVDTFEIINHAMNHGKQVALPRCIDGTREMEFHVIDSLDQLSPRTFSVLEPDEGCPTVTDFTDALMIVPALSLDQSGYRLGYGGGYYDRYMSRFNGKSIGICYCADYVRHIKHGRYDKPVDIVITDKFIRKAKRGRDDLQGGLK
jgi:5-formyltetrahydrofolate cyclo-ligase